MLLGLLLKSATRAPVNSRANTSVSSATADARHQGDSVRRRRGLISIALWAELWVGCRNGLRSFGPPHSDLFGRMRFRPLLSPGSIAAAKQRSTLCSTGPSDPRLISPSPD